MKLWRKLECEFLLKKIVFVQEVSSTATAAVAADEAAADGAELTARPFGLCGMRRAAQPSPDASFEDAVGEVCKIILFIILKKYVLID